MSFKPETLNTRQARHMGVPVLPRNSSPLGGQTQLLSLRQTIFTFTLPWTYRIAVLASPRSSLPPQAGKCPAQSSDSGF